MAKTIEEINEQFRLSMQKKETEPEEPEAAVEPVPEEAKEQPAESVSEILAEKAAGGKSSALLTISSVLINILFYGTVVVFLISIAGCVLLKGGHTIMGYRLINIQQEAVQDIYASGTLVFADTKNTGALTAGDAIVYYSALRTNTIDTIVEPLENWDERGSTGYITQGAGSLNNNELVLNQSEITGKAVFGIPYVGTYLEYMDNNLWKTMGGFILILLFSTAIKILIAGNKRERLEMES